MVTLYKYPFTKQSHRGNTLVVVDVSAVMRSKFIPLDQSGKPRPKRTLSYTVAKQTFNTSSLYGLFSLFKQYGLDVDYIFCFDSNYNLLKEIDPTYKGGRVDPGEEYDNQVKVAWQVLRDCQFNVAMVHGYEADHMIHVAINQHYAHYERILVVTNDQDLACTVDDKVVWVNTLKKRADIWLHNYEEVVDCPYNTVLLKKSLVGDGSDKIKGVKGFGPLRFAKFLVAEKLDDPLKVAGNEYAIIKQATSLNEEQKKQALHALNLVYPKFPPQYSIPMYHTIHTTKWQSYLIKYGMNSLFSIWELAI